MGFYDLSTLSSEDVHRRQRRWRIPAAVLLSTACAFMLWFLYLALVVPRFHDSDQWLIFAIVEAGWLALAVECIFWILFFLRPGAVGLDVDASGLAIQWSSGRQERLSWATLTRSFHMNDYSGNRLMIRYSPLFLWELRIRWRPKTCVPREAYEEIRAVAVQQGLRIVETREPRAFFGAQQQLYAFRGMAHIEVRLAP